MPRSVRQGVTADHVLLVDLWRRSVEATHTFLTAQDIDELYPDVRDIYLPAVDLWVVTKAAIITGFMGLGDKALYNGAHYRKIEMLFIEPSARGTGIGTALIDFAAHRHGMLCVDVNEQNSAARGFYESKGFTARARSALDAQGRPFPLLHMYRK